MDTHVVQVPWASHSDRLTQIRQQVFVIEQGVAQEEEWDGRDEAATHFLAVNEMGVPVGCARLLDTGQIGRMAVLKSERGKGIGRRLLEAAIEQAIQQGMRSVSLHAQTHALGFYRKAGFIEQGSEFLEAGIPHFAMSLELPIPFEPVGNIPRPLIRPEPAEEPDASGNLRSDQGEQECSVGLVECFGAPRRHLQLLHPNLDPLLFDRLDTVEAISAFLRSSRTTRMQIIIQDSSLIVARGHRLIELARRLDSHLEIRKSPDDTATNVQSFMTWDNRGYWHMPDFRAYQVLRNDYDPVHATRLGEQFSRLWSRSTPDPELRVLRL